MSEPDAAPRLCHGELRDQPSFSGIAIRVDGTLSLLIRGRGLIYGPMSPNQMREIAHRLLATADAREAKLALAGDAALAELATIVTAGSA